ncbi:hypothetical protein NT2_13_00840 [Caenibius tardaugens NBRC 16725]|uniref:Uncharacterized protein n=1 Tax=Caenibius tardaugens NBRC 16725 TaxID=1219035 RepID=U2YQM5_9SPHN|nr:hypothetical protein [Caenibius tardaugens]AZI37875.1 hypothetical protein EGO55_19490 [Caenibius tardaugens NBRC 16725]GAD50997.1 hypothetical protein NT2_13_00840 [Caenibius tardaugens NBRC 16725]
MIVETSKGAVSLADATAVTVKRSLLAYVPKLIGLAVAIVGLIFIVGLIVTMITERANTPWYGWLIAAFLAVLTLPAIIGSGLTMIGDTGEFTTVKGEGKSADAYNAVTFILLMLGVFSLIMYGMMPQLPHSVALPVSIICFVLAGATNWSKSLAGVVNVTVAYRGHSANLHALDPVEAEQITAAFRRRAAAD